MTLHNLSVQLAKCLVGTELEGTTHFAGGCVRDYLMQSGAKGCYSPDIDICIELRDGSTRLAAIMADQLNATLISSHPEFGTCKLAFNGVTLELVSTRREVYRYPSRYPKVSFGTLREDTMRRDFSINALMMNVCNLEMHDLCGFGKQDLEQGLIRCIGNPAERFREDPLRLLRAMRFALRFRFAYESATHLAMQSGTNELKRLSERLIHGEIDKVLMNNSRDELMDALGQLGWTGKLGSYLPKANYSR